MPLPAQVLATLGMASMFLSMGAAWLAAPKLKAWLKRQTPSIEVPDFDFYEQRSTDRLISLLWRVRVPPDRPRLRSLVLAHRGLLIAAPLLMLAAAMLMTSADDRRVEGPDPGLPPPTSLKIAGDLEPAP